MTVDHSFHHVASVILISKSGQLILQRRDDKPGIRHPGMVTPWGGMVEGDETPLEAAVRETAEETNLRPGAEDFYVVGEYRRGYEINGKSVVNHVYALRNVDELSLQVFEGAGYALVDPKATTDNPLYPDLTRKLIEDFNEQGGWL